MIMTYMLGCWFMWANFNCPTYKSLDLSKQILYNSEENFPQIYSPDSDVLWDSSMTVLLEILKI